MGWGDLHAPDRTAAAVYFALRLSGAIAQTLDAHVSFADAVDVERWVSKMAADEFYLPGELPDATFKRPAWMGGR